MDRWTNPPTARLEQINYKGESTNWRMVIDQDDEPVGVVTRRYKLVQNSTLIQAIEDRVRDAERGKAVYWRGRSEYHWTIPGLEFQGPGDKHPIQAMLVLNNDYRGKGFLRLELGWYRLICTNGMRRRILAEASLARHVNALNVEKFVVNAIMKFEQAAYSDRDSLVRIGAQNASPTLISTIRESLAKRYRGGFDRSLEAYQSELGATNWALIQTITDVSSNRMQARQRHNWSADQWATQQIERIENSLVEA